MTITTQATTATTTRATTPATTTTRRLLTGGAIAGPLFAAVSLTQAATRDGYDLTRHPFSMLSLGHHGWIQVTNFLVAGVLYAASSVGLRRTLRSGRGRTWAPLLFAVFGVSLIGGGVFRADPAFGFPLGAPDGRPDVLSWHGALHGVAAAVGFLSLIAVCFVLTRRFAAARDRRWTAYSVVTGGVFLVATVASFALADRPGVNVLLMGALVLGLCWASSVAARQARQVR